MAQAKKKKRFFDVDISILNKDTQLFAYSIEELDNRIIKYDLTRLLRGKNAILTLKVSLQGKELVTRPKEIQLLPYFIKKMVRKGTNYVEDSFSAECLDAQMRIKPFLVTRRKVSRGVRKALREKAKEELIDYLKSKTTEAIFQEIIQNKLQKTLSIRLKKVYPLSLCEIRIIKVEKELDKKEADTKKPKEKPQKKERLENADEILEEAEEMDSSEEE